MSRGLVAILVIGGAALVAFFLFGRKAKAASNVELTNGGMSGKSPQTCVNMGFATKCVENSKLTPISEKFKPDGSKQVCVDVGFKKCITTEEALPPPPPPPPGWSDPGVGATQPNPPTMYSGQFGVGADALNRTRTGTTAF